MYITATAAHYTFNLDGPAAHDVLFDISKVIGGVFLYFPLKGRCSRENCKYLHPPSHLKTQLEINGRNNLIQQKTAAAMLAQQMQLMLPGPSLQPVVRPSSSTQTKQFVSV